MNEFVTGDGIISEMLVGELISAQRQLFKTEEGTWINLDHVHVATVEEGVLHIMVGTQRGTIEDTETIARFWEQWEIV